MDDVVPGQLLPQLDFSHGSRWERYDLLAELQSDLADVLTDEEPGGGLQRSEILNAPGMNPELREHRLEDLHELAHGLVSVDVGLAALQAAHRSRREADHFQVVCRQRDDGYAVGPDEVLEVVDRVSDVIRHVHNRCFDARAAGRTTTSGLLEGSSLRGVRVPLAVALMFP